MAETSVSLRWMDVRAKYTSLPFKVPVSVDLSSFEKMVGYLDDNFHVNQPYEKLEPIRNTALAKNLGILLAIKLYRWLRSSLAHGVKCQAGPGRANALVWFPRAGYQ